MVRYSQDHDIVVLGISKLMQYFQYSRDVSFSKASVPRLIQYTRKIIKTNASVESWLETVITKTAKCWFFPDHVNHVIRCFILEIMSVGWNCTFYWITGKNKFISHIHSLYTEGKYIPKSNASSYFSKFSRAQHVLMTTQVQGKLLNKFTRTLNIFTIIALLAPQNFLVCFNKKESRGITLEKAKLVK